MASSYPFRRIIGMELLKELNVIALQNMLVLSQRSAEML